MKQEVANIFKNLLPLFSVFIVFSLIIFIVKPFGNYPVNDDWDFLLHVKYFSEGNFVKNALIDASFILQGLIALPWVKILGLNFVNLRFLTIIFTFFLFIGSFLYLKKLKLSNLVLFLALFSILVDPFFVFSSFSFMTEIYFLTFVIFSIYFYYQSKSPYLALLFAFLSCFIRQFGYILLISYSLHFIIQKKTNILKILPLILAGVALLGNLLFPAYVVHNASTIAKFTSLFGSILDIFNKITYLPKYLPYLAFTLSPLVLATNYKFHKDKIFYSIFLFASVLIFYFDIFDLKNVFHIECYLCETDFRDTISFFNNIPFKLALATLLGFVLTKFSYLMYNFYLNKEYKNVINSKISLPLFFAVISLLAILISESFYDRYFLIISIMLIFVYCEIFKNQIIFNYFSILSLCFNFIIILFLNLDFHNSMKARWLLGEELISKTNLTSQIYVTGTFNKYFNTINKNPEELVNPIKLGPQNCFVLRYLKPSNNLLKTFFESRLFNNKYLSNPNFSGAKDPNNLVSLKDNKENVIGYSEYNSPIFSLLGYKSFYVAVCNQSIIKTYNLQTLPFFQ